jgi:hypothetical protein
MDRAAALTKKNTLTVSRGAQTAGVFRPINESALKLLPGHGKKLRRALNVAFGEINEALLLAAFRTPRLALEAHAVILSGRCRSWISNSGSPVSIDPGTRIRSARGLVYPKSDYSSVSP